VGDVDSQHRLNHALMSTRVMAMSEEDPWRGADEEDAGAEKTERRTVVDQTAIEVTDSDLNPSSPGYYWPRRTRVRTAVRSWEGNLIR
jgi:hypothetical protein